MYRKVEKLVILIKISGRCSLEQSIYMDIGRLRYSGSSARGPAATVQNPNQYDHK